MIIRSIVCLVALLALPLTAHAQVDDHLECYSITDPVQLDGIVDLSSPQFGAASGCRIGRARLFCVPATKSVVSARDRKTRRPIAPLDVSGPDAGDRVCYKLTCPAPFPPDTAVSDQFGFRTLTRFKTSLLCVPAIKGPPPPSPPPTPPTPAPSPCGIVGPGMCAGECGTVQGRQLYCVNVGGCVCFDVSPTPPPPTPVP